MDRSRSSNAWKRLWSTTLLAALASCAFALAACGGDDESASADASGDGASERATVTVGLLPLAAVAPVYLGIEQGYFDEENLEVKTQVAQGGAAIVPAVQSGNMQFAYSNNVSPLLAQAQGLKLRVVAEGNQEAPQRENATEGIIVKPDSGIREPKDLEGKTVAVNTLKNIGTIAIQTALEAAGVDYTKVKFVEVPFPDMLAAVEKGRVDAAEVVEPFLGQAKANDMRVIINPFFETGEELGGAISIASYFTSQEYAEKNPEIVERFVRALNKGTQYAADNPDAVRKAVQEYADLPAEVANKMTLPFFSTDLSEETFPFLAERMAKYEMVPDAPDLEGLLPEGSGD